MCSDMYALSEIQDNYAKIEGNRLEERSFAKWCLSTFALTDTEEKHYSRRKYGATAIQFRRLDPQSLHSVD